MKNNYLEKYYLEKYYLEKYYLEKYYLEKYYLEKYKYFFIYIMPTLSLTFTNTPGSVSLPITGSNLAVSINWGDGTTDTSTSHNYAAAAGPFTAVVTVTSGTVTRFGNNGIWTGSNKLTTVATDDLTTWGLPGVTNFRTAFRGASTLTEVPANIPTTVNSCKDMFNGASVFNQDIGGWTMGGVTDMEGMFNGASAFDQDISSWDTSTVNDMEKMFHQATNFDQNIRVWDTTSVGKYNRMFDHANAMNATYGHLASFGGNNANTPTSAFFTGPPPPPPNPICFPKGTPVSTNLGPVAIEKLNTDKHTIRGKEIVAITQSRPLQKHIVCLEKDSLSKNVPSQQTLCSMEHKIFYKGDMIKARNIVDLCENVTFVPYNGETLFNVLLKKHDKMMINNLICETLHPENIAAKISTMKNGQKKNKANQELTKIIEENNVEEYKKLYTSL